MFRFLVAVQLLSNSCSVRNQVYKALKRNPLPADAKAILVQPDHSGEVFSKLQQIPEASREAIVLICIEGFTYDDASQTLNV